MNKSMYPIAIYVTVKYCNMSKHHNILTTSSLRKMIRCDQQTSVMFLKQMLSDNIVSKENGYYKVITKKPKKMDKESLFISKQYLRYYTQSQQKQISTLRSIQKQRTDMFKTISVDLPIPVCSTERVEWTVKRVKFLSL